MRASSHHLKRGSGLKLLAGRGTEGPWEQKMPLAAKDSFEL